MWTERWRIDNIPASVRVIKIVKDPETQEDAYTIEFEAETERAKDLLSELMSCSLGKQLIHLINESKFLPEDLEKTAEQLKQEMEAEEKEREERENELREEGKTQGKSDEWSRFRIWFKKKNLEIPSDDELDEAEKESEKKSEDADATDEDQDRDMNPMAGLGFHGRTR